MSRILDPYQIAQEYNSNEKSLNIDSPLTEEILSSEDAELAKLGYKQEFKREFSWLSTFSFAFSISGLLATVYWDPSELMPGYFNLGFSACSRWASSYSLVLVNFSIIGTDDLVHWRRVMYVHCYQCR